MVSTFTPFINLEEPARGDYVGTWDLPVNSNMTIVDLVVGGQNTVTVGSSAIILASSQYQSSVLTFSSTLTASITVTLPTSFKKPYKVYNTCTGSSAFTITLQTTGAGGEVVCAPPGRFVDILNDGTNIRFTSLENIGAYWDYAGSSVPAWVSGCTKPPYLYCNGGTFSATTYPQLSVILGSTTLPDYRGRANFYLNDGAVRLSSGGAGIDGNTRFATGGSNGIVLGSSQIPSLSITGVSVNAGGANIPLASNTIFSIGAPSGSPLVVPYIVSGGWTGTTTLTGTGSYTNASPTGVGISFSGIVGGIRMIRAG